MIVYKTVDQGRFAEAEEPLRRGLETSWRASLPIEDQALALNNLAYSRLLRESYDEALVLLRRSVALRQTALGADHPETAMSLANLATAAHATGHHDEARDVLLEAIESWRRRDPDHPMVALLLGNLGAVEQALGDRRAAERSFVEAADHYERRLGDRHPSTARAWNNLGNLFAETGRLREAQHYLRRAHSVVEDRFGPEHPETLTTLWNLIATEIDAGQARRAEASLVEQLDRSAEDPDFPSSDLEHGVQVVARLLRAEGRHAEAERLVARLAEPENRP